MRYRECVYEIKQYLSSLHIVEMITPVNVIISVDASKKTAEANSRILKVVAHLLESLSPNDEVAFAFVSEDKICTMPFKAVRTPAQRSAIVNEISLANDGSASESDIARTLQCVANIIDNKLGASSCADAWRPCYVALFTDGRPVAKRRDAIVTRCGDLFTHISSAAQRHLFPPEGGSSSSVGDGGAVATNFQQNVNNPLQVLLEPLYFLDVFFCNSHRPHKELIHAAQDTWGRHRSGPSLNMSRLTSDMEILKSAWKARSHIARCRASVDLRSIPQSMARRKAPALLRIPSAFTK